MSYLDSIPTSASPAASDDSSNPPRTPVSPLMHSLPLTDPATANSAAQQPTNQNQGNNQPKRKPSRRANTAERRATHNAVERQRRETLNGRFLDLAGLLPNLSQIRRPSKSSIVNSSIAYVHASRRHRSLAARELRAVKAESDTLRREVNEWRDRANLPRVEEPVRSDGFAMVLNGELETLTSFAEEEEDMAAHNYDGYDDAEDDFGPPFTLPTDEVEDTRSSMAQNLTMLKNANTFGHQVSLDAGPPQHIAQVRRPALQHQLPIIVTNPPTVSYENPAMASLFEHPYGAGHFITQQTLESDKIATWNAQVYAQQQQAQAIRPQYNQSPRSSVSDATSFVDMFGNYQRQQPQPMASLPLHGAHMYGTDSDDSSSVGSGRGRSGSVSGGSGFASPHHHGSPVSYDLPGIQADYCVPRKISTVSLGMTPNAWRDADGMIGLGMMKQGLGSPMGNGTGFGVMM